MQEMAPPIPLGRFLSGAVFLSLLSSAAGVAVSPGPALEPRGGNGGNGPACKSIPGDSRWPGASEWATLNQTVGGRLIASRPAADVCHVEPFHVYDAAACVNLQTNWDRPETHLFNPVEFNTPYFQNQSCDPFTPSTQPCVLGNYVSYAINVTGVSDIVAGLKFAAQKNVRLVIKNTGHDYLGKSTGKGGLSFWTHNLKTININPTYHSSFYNGPAIKLGAGVLAGEAYVAAWQAGYRVVGGTCPTVGIAGGYTQGGGHSLLSSLYGLAADNVLEWEVVTPGGNRVVATPTKNSDLYWALSGGGGGTYGIVLSLTTRLHADGIVGGAGLSFNDSVVGNDAFWGAVSSWHAGLPAIIDSGNTVTYMLLNGSFILYSITAPGRNATGVTALLAPFLADLTTRGIAYTFAPRVSATFLDHFEHDFGPLPYGPFPVSQLTGSRLLPRGAVTNPTKNAAVTSALRTVTHSGNFYLGCNAINTRATPQPGHNRPANAVNPAWRDSVSHCIVVGPWDYTIPRADMLTRLNELTNVITPALEAATPGSGTYLNEANFQQANWQTQFYGSSYNRLKQIKKKYDPKGLLYATTAVGSDDWVIDGSGRVCRAP
ncbi:hypothetical protein B0H67DRAFT_614299 [Lasiosphaeris hirsuta]|uniref:FAD-binding PCMH-type domain-containing protein n=1 Tax=Lasiosphaeris hirsuta TaxID=260670 RepID=A0AA39ZS05_9PEZI|nr:hypothetical protein B0H67DRAFT_614299 [Lasiosphaeris hirsuta]